MYSHICPLHRRAFLPHASQVLNKQIECLRIDIDIANTIHFIYVKMKGTIIIFLFS